jgi:DNA topoisomerase-6 subunit A
MATKQKKTSAVEKKLVGIADIVVTAAERSKDPTFAIPIRALSNVSFNPARA